MDYYYNILITGCSSGLGEALFNKVWEHDFLKPFGHYRTEDGDPYALIGDITDSDFPEKLDNYIREREIDCFINNAGVYQGDIIDTNLGYIRLTSFNENSSKQIKEKVSKFAGTLKNQGINKGDRVIIYMPMIPRNSPIPRISHNRENIWVVT